MDVYKVNSNVSMQPSSYLKTVRTGLFVNWEKSLSLIQVVETMLQERFNTVPTRGPRLDNNTCEIILQALKPSAHFAGSKDLLENYLRLIDESRSGILVRKQPEVIDLSDDDVDTSCVVLDESLNRSVTVIDLDTGTELQVLKPKGKVNHTANTSALEDIIIIDPVQVQGSSPIPCEVKLNGDFNKSNNKLLKRKRVSLEPADEVLDDEVIVLDDTLFVENRSEDASNTNHRPPICDLQVVEDVTVVEESVSNIVSVGIGQRNVLSTLPLEVYDLSAAREHSGSNSYGSQRKFSRLAYKRTAHLIESLTKYTENDSSDNITNSNIFNPNANTQEKRTGLRPIVIDGNNVGTSRGEFSLRRLQICINYFEKRGHRQIKAFLPHHRINKSTFEALKQMEQQGTVVFTPSRKVHGKRVTSYDDRFIVQYATEFGGVIVTTDNYRDLLQENPSWKDTIEQRILMFSWADDLLMFPQDPMGRYGPSLDEFLQFPN